MFNPNIPEPVRTALLTSPSGPHPVPPRVAAHLGPSLSPNLIKEGDDVYFECSVSAKPPTTNVVWKHDVSTALHFSLLLTSAYYFGMYMNL